MDPTTWFSRKSLVARAVWGGAITWTRTNLFWEVALAQRKRLSCNIRLYTCWFIVLSSTTSWPLPPWWNPAHDRWTGIAICSLHTHTHTSMGLSPCRLRTRACPSVCNLNLDSFVKIQCLYWRVSQTRWRFVHWQRRRRCTNVSQGHRAGPRE